MIAGHVFIATSLDGFIAREDGDIGWLIARDDPAEDHGHEAFMSGIDAVVMGRGTFEVVRSFSPWPYACPVVVMSRSLGAADLPPGVAARVTDRTPAEAMDELAAQGARRVYVDGGRLIQSFLRAGLIADLVITRVPVLLGQGRSLFGALPADIALVHEETRAFPSGLVQSRYRVAT